MKTKLFLPLGLLAMGSLCACSDNDTASTTNTDSLSTSTTVDATTATTTSTTTHTLSENETYTDLRSGTTFKVKKDASGSWTRDNGEALGYYLSPVSHDTFYGPTGRWVNNALNYDPGSGYSIDEIRWNQMNADNSSMQGTDMQADKVKETDEELKMKSADGEDKVKITDEETKIKTREGVKIKSNENETKIKQK
jgi:hypothetical protein